MRKKGRIRMLLGVILIVMAGLLLGHNLIEDHLAGSSAKKVVTSLKASTGTKVAKPSLKKTAKVNGTAYSGYLSFPSLGLSLPVAAKWRFSQLEVSPATYYGKPETRDWVVAGHNFTTQFGKLTNLNIGDTVNFVGTSGYTFVYRVAKMEIIKPTAIKKMVDNKYDLSLFTCNYDGTARYTVRCSLVTAKR